MLWDIFLDLITPFFAPFISSSRYFLLYLLFAALMAFVILYRRQPLAERTLKGAFARLFDRRVFLHPSALLDCRLAVTNHILIAVLVGFLFLSTSTITGGVVAGLNATLGPVDGAVAGLGASIAFTAALFLANDFSNFLKHWAEHRVPILWEFHKVHHSAEVLTPLTAIRVHPVSEVFGSVVIASALGIVNGVFLYVYHDPVAQMTVLGANALQFAYYTIGAYHLAHSHVWLLFPKGLRAVFISPALHMIHHSANPKHFGRNFAFSLTIWDRMAGTLYMPAENEGEGLVLGIGDEQADFQTVQQLYMTPFRNVARLLRARPISEAPTVPLQAAE